MYIASKHYDKAIQKTRIELGTLVGCDTDDEAYIVLKELPTEKVIESQSIQKAKKDDVVPFLNFMKDALPHVIVDHNFYIDEHHKMSNEDLVNFLFEKRSLTTKVLTDYSQWFRDVSGPDQHSGNSKSSN